LRRSDPIHTVFFSNSFSFPNLETLLKPFSHPKGFYDLSQVEDCAELPNSPLSLLISLSSSIERRIALVSDNEQDFQFLRKNFVMNVVSLNINRFLKSRTVPTSRIVAQILNNLTASSENLEV